MKAIEQYFLVVLLSMLYKVILTFEPMNEILKILYIFSDSVTHKLVLIKNRLKPLYTGFILKEKHKHMLVKTGQD